MPRKYRHFIYELYLALAAANGKNGLNLTEAEARNKIKGWLPNFADMVDPIIQAGGDLAKIPAAMVQQTEDVINGEDSHLQGHTEMNRRLRDGSGRYTRADESQGDNGNRSDTEGMNGRLRQGRQSIPADATDETMNGLLRGRAGLA